MAQLLDAYSDYEPLHHTDDIHAPAGPNHHHSNEPPPPLLNDTTLDPLIATLTQLPWLSWVQTFALSFLLLLIAWQMYKCVGAFIARRRRRAASKIK